MTILIAGGGVGGLTLALMLEARGIAYRESKVPSAGVWQIFLTDPNNVTLELNFPAEE